MDLQEWELLSDDGFHDFDDDNDDRKKISSMAKRSNASRTGFDMYHFRCLPELIPIPIQLNPSIGMPSNDDAVTKRPILETVKNRAPSLQGVTTKADQDAVSKVIFKESKVDGFVDMKLDSPKSPTRGIIPRTDSGSFRFEDKSEAKQNSTSPRRKTDDECEIKVEDDNWEVKSDVTVNIWKWSLTGIGAICSFGVAAATVCIFVFGNQQRSKQQQQNQKPRFQIHDDERDTVNSLKDVIPAAKGAGSMAHLILPTVVTSTLFRSAH